MLAGERSFWMFSPSVFRFWRGWPLDGDAIGESSAFEPFLAVAFGRVPEVIGDSFV